MIATHARASRVQLELNKDNPQTQAEPLEEPEENEDAAASFYEVCSQDEDSLACSDTQTHIQSPDQIIIERMSGKTLFVRRNGRYLLVNLFALKQDRAARDYQRRVEQNCVATHTLSIPFALRPQEGLIKALKKALVSAERCGFKLAISRNQISVLSVPALIKDVELSSFCSRAFAVIASSDELLKGRCPRTLSELIAGAAAQDLEDSEINELLSSFDADDERNRAVCRVLDIRKAVATFEEQV